MWFDLVNNNMIHAVMEDFIVYWTFHFALQLHVWEIWLMQTCSLHLDKMIKIFTLNYNEVNCYNVL